MPVISDKKTITTIKEFQSCCKVCEKRPFKNERIFICDVCNEWICKDCSDISESVYELASKQQLKINFVCSLCNEQLPKIRECLKLAARQQKMEEEISHLKNCIEANTNCIKENSENNTDVKERLEKVEKMLGLDTNQLSNEDYPSLFSINATTKTLAEKISNQESTTNELNEQFQKQQEIKSEEKRQAARAHNLIIYGIPEEEDGEKEQMEQDFLTLRNLLAERVSIKGSDISDIVRLGAKKEDKTRPVKITCTSIEKRKEILTSNKNLRIEDENFEYCGCKINPGNHIHINITNDKTQKQREEESKLREELKRRRNNGEQVIIKQGKIVKSTKTNAHPRWAEISENGLY